MIQSNGINLIIKELDEYHRMLVGDDSGKNGENSIKKEATNDSGPSYYGNSFGNFVFGLPSFLVGGNSKRDKVTKNNQESIKKLIKEVKAELMKIEKPK